MVIIIQVYKIDEALLAMYMFGKLRILFYHCETRCMQNLTQNLTLAKQKIV